MILFHHIIKVLDLADDDHGPVLRINWLRVLLIGITS